MAKIESLTPEQEVQLKEWRAKWFAIGTATGRSDRPKVEKAIAALYAEINRPAPEFVWCESPAAAEKVVRERTGDPSATFQTPFWGQYDAYWVAYYLFAHEVLGVQFDEKRLAQLYLWADLCHTGWFGCWEKVCICCERPKVQLLDETERPHCNDGPAIQFADGWSVWVLNGVGVPKNVVLTPEDQTVEEIEAEANEEVRRICIERFAGAHSSRDEGWIRYLKLSHATLLDERENPVEQTREFLVQDSRKRKHLITYCPSTGRVYCLLAEDPEGEEGGPTIKNCADAQKFFWSGSKLAEMLGEFRVVGRS